MKDYLYRTIHAEEAEQAAEIEQICFPPNEACAWDKMLERVQTAPELFLVAVDGKSRKIVGCLNGLATDENAFRDEFFTNADLFQPGGKNIMLLGLGVLPEYRHQGIARELVKRYADRERAKERESLILTCLRSKVAMYEKMGFEDEGISGSSWGGEEWHEMKMRLSNTG
ncbi:MAG: GNAT family N-acetyltransferase [Lachnospiraceae bacterium]|nr:GNAT family N-acetyltransferase [Lachnospiraceae bacterium]